MPALPSTSLLSFPIALITPNASATTNATNNAFQVVCAWPVSGQYGPGSRILYYILITACVFARKAEWLRNACIAAALLFPAVAAIHGIVLASLHVDNAVDMDVYGAFQLCAIGILAAPVTVKLSKTYFYDPGRNTIFVWTGLILAGLLSLTVEFFRTNASPCTDTDSSGNPITLSQFVLGTNLCGLDYCVVSNTTYNAGPSSPLRHGSANNIYVIPVPDRFTFNTATLFAAACCIPAVLSLISMWNKILEINWKKRFGNRDRDEDGNEVIEGTNGATPRRMNRVNSYIGLFLNAVEILVFGAAIMAILVIGERNFWSQQVIYQTEPIASIGQWAPIVGTGLAVLGSLYLLLVLDLEAEEEAARKEAGSNASSHHCNCSTREVHRDRYSASIHSVATPGDQRSVWGGRKDNSAESPQRTIEVSHDEGHHRRVARASTTGTFGTDVGNRRRVASVLMAVGNYLGTAAHDRFGGREFQDGIAADFPEIPGEEQRNPGLSRIRRGYNPNRDADGHVTPMVSRRPSFELQNVSSRPGINGTKVRGATLAVPAAVHHHPTRTNSAPTPSLSITTTPGGPSSPAIMVSSDPDISPFLRTPTSTSPAPPP